MRHWIVVLRFVEVTRIDIVRAASGETAGADFAGRLCSIEEVLIGQPKHRYNREDVMGAPGMTCRVEPGDCREVIATLGVMVDAVVTDAPYDLNFMRQRWDGEGIAFDPETWRIIGSVLRPGGFLVAFGSPRTHHRLACAIEDAGFVIQDCLLWLFATGFPKRRDMLKPAYEPIVLAYKPGGRRTLQVEECRIAAETIRTVQTPSQNAGTIYGADQRTRVEFINDTGRWPANICHDGSDEVVALFPRSAGQQGDVRGTEPSPLTDAVYNGRQRVPFNKREGEASAERRYAKASGFAMLPGERRRDGGSAARFFFSAKAGKQDRWGSRHPTVKPVELLKWLVPLVTPPGGLVLDPFAGSGTTAVAARATGRDCILIEREDQYIADIRERLAFYEGGGRHSAVAKNRNRKRDAGPLFIAPAPSRDPPGEAA